MGYDILKAPVFLGSGSAGSSPVEIGVVYPAMTVVITQIDGYVIGTLAGPGAPALLLQWPLVGDSLLLAGVVNDLTAIWEAHWTGEKVILPTDITTIVNANSVSLDVINCTLSGYTASLSS